MASGTTCSAPSITVARVVENKRVGFQSRLHHLGFQVMSGVSNINDLRHREGSLPVALPPPLAFKEIASRSGCGRIFPLFSRDSPFESKRPLAKTAHPEKPKSPTFQADLQNVDLALTRFCAGCTQVFLSGYNHLK